MSEEEIIAKLRERTKGWALNDDKAWIKVKLGEVRAALEVIDRNPPVPRPIQKKG